MAAPLRIGVLDQSPIVAGATAADALEASLKLAQFADQRGFSRYWFAEHHGSEAFAGAAPEVLIGQALARTRRIRVGSGGVMLMHYSPLKVAETFNLLQTLYPDRVDLGIGRAPGSDGITAAALAYGSQIGIEYFPAKLADLAAFLESRKPHSEGLAPVQARPRVTRPPGLWMLGSSTDGAQLAAQFGLPYCHAHFIGPEHTAAASNHYLDRFQPAPELTGQLGCRRPQLALGVFVSIAETDEEAQLQGRCRDLWRLRIARGEFLPFPSRQEAREARFSAAEAAHLESKAAHAIQGTP
ncbi:MAG: LLM class flavin-dependent oxidoreductase, partial [Pseudomonadota bacterium]